MAPEGFMVGEGRRRPALEGVAAADRALAVLAAFRKGDGAVSLAELAARTGLVKSTIMRLAVTLEARGFLAREGDGAYRLDAEVLRLGTAYTQSFRLEAHVIPVLEELVARTGETASFYVRRGERRLCLFRADSPHLLRMHVQVGRRAAAGRLGHRAGPARLRAAAVAGLRGVARPARGHDGRDGCAHGRHGRAGVRAGRRAGGRARAVRARHPLDTRGAGGGATDLGWRRRGAHPRIGGAAPDLLSAADAAAR
jgi:hypothetical protein